MPEVDLPRADAVADPAAETIVAISTPPGRGGIGIVRLSGPQAIAIAAALVRVQGPLEHARARFGFVLDSAAPQSDNVVPAQIDEAVVTAFRAPRSYTGEDVAEIAAHGAPVILDAIVAGALRLGARLARPGEFTERAFLSGRLDLTQAEAVHDLIAAQTLDQARTAARQLGGALSRRVAPAKERLLHLIALLEAGMDFASGELDDVETVPPAHIAEALTAVTAPLAALHGSFRSGHLRRTGTSLALVGLPNAGKSSLFNRLLDRERSIVTAAAGTTRDTVEEVLALSGIPVRLIDTAGLRGEALPEGPVTLDEAERLGVARSREALADADLVVLVHDATLPLAEAEQAMLDELSGRPHLLVHNKIDLAGAGKPDGTREAVAVSALTGEGLADLRQRVLERLGTQGGVAAEGELNNLRQEQALRRTLDALASAAEANQAHLPHEILLLDLHSALRGLDELTGATTADDILGRIFATFCIGK